MLMSDPYDYKLFFVKEWLLKKLFQIGLHETALYLLTLRRSVETY
jgi:hypothetical protein